MLLTCEKTEIKNKNPKHEYNHEYLKLDKTNHITNATTLHVRQHYPSQRQRHESHPSSKDNSTQPKSFSQN